MELKLEFQANDALLKSCVFVSGESGARIMLPEAESRLITIFDQKQIETFKMGPISDVQFEDLERQKMLDEFIYASNWKSSKTK